MRFGGFMRFACFVMLTGLVACDAQHTDGGTKSQSPATVAKPVKEEELATVTLTAEAEKRLGITTTPIELETVEPTRTFGGELMVALGRSSDSGADAPASGAPAHGESIYSLLPALTPAELTRLAEQQLAADAEVRAAKVHAETARLEAARAEALLAGKAGSLRRVEEARAQARLARIALETAQDRRALLGVPLFDAVKRDVLWLRVPVYVGALQDLNTEVEAQVGRLGDPPGAPTRAAKPIDAPISGAAGSASVDLLYEVGNQDGVLRAGERVSVNVPMKGGRQSLVAPWAAVLHDAYGGAWVYERTGPLTYARRRVQVHRVLEGVAILASGPKAGTEIVTDGAVELFGTELGFGK